MRTRLILPFAAALACIAAARFQGGVTAEVAIGKSVASGMPVDTASSFGADAGTVVCWTRITGAAAGSKIMHVWIHGADTAKVELNVGGSPWRTYSRKTIPADMTGDWKVDVMDDKGNVITSKSFKIG
jgi:hypothetical protein